MSNLRTVRVIQVDTELPEYVFVNHITHISPLLDMDEEDGHKGSRIELISGDSVAVIETPDELVKTIEGMDL